ncbi:5-Formyltetrahydrofolate cycloligase [Coccomyxa subellipsoidea C-169]|uniref:5-formyltetrahydrofolate cyclo-ligase n=1 Tax=Coccomyxa subellipsoidea (strain C-169) TaxID=574566 RepID=I0YJK8_COCSC|nr:5-Formyltetrahydrofolate cycloligase [Coccomyxa subellipsoidea C-169]EIE18577.1 5-Formyltetrahydrofolate cycloligase [Coccomyxa subellipsoidea C-169]|eukprot:XP_005643121.1 5-Formyltetrahydrofolate cycloligase [Coccomyxa subellipsoidea C-169]
MQSSSTANIVDDKKVLRKKVVAELKKLTAAQMHSESSQIADHILKADFYQRCKRIGVYIHCAPLREVDTSKLVTAVTEADKRCYIPVVQDREANMRLIHLDTLEDLKPAPPFNILEPPPTYADGRPREDVLEMDAPLDLLLMPGLAFDSQGRRCGRGGGYYDKFLARCQQRAQQHGWDPPLLVALAFRAQMVGAVPMCPYDRSVDIIVTADGMLSCSTRSQQLQLC